MFVHFNLIFVLKCKSTEHEKPLYAKRFSPQESPKQSVLPAHP